jgi:two-component system, sporulation sensor kinase E
MARVFPLHSTGPPASCFKDPTNIVNYRQRGWVNVGRTRMVLFDILHGFYNIRKVIQKEVGENANYLIFQAGIKGGYSFLVPMIRGERIDPGPQGFRDALSIYTDAGFGDFRIQELNWDNGWACITCDSSFEGWIHARKRRRRTLPSCDYTRGIVLAFMRATHRFAGTDLESHLDCVETSCLAAGDDVCEYLIGTHDEIRAHGFECSKPRKSIQEQLRERVRQKTSEIKEANRFYENILKNAPVGIFTLDSRGVIASANPALTKIAGITHREFIGMSLLNNDTSLSRSLSDHVSRGLGGESFELVNYSFNGTDSPPRFVTVKGIPLKNARGDPEGLLCIAEDTTEKTLSSRRVEYLKTYNENIIHSITDGIMVLDPALRIQTWNRKMEEIFQVKAERVLGKSFVRVAGSLAEPRIFDHLRTVIGTGVPITQKGVRIPTKTRGTIVLNLKIIPLFDEQREIAGLIVLHEDVTDRERIEIRYQNLFETANDGILVMDLDGHFVSVNRRALEMLGGDLDSLRGTSFCRFLSSDRRPLFTERLARVARGQEVEPCELQITRISGEKIPVEISITGIKSREKSIGLQAIMRDIRERKRIEQELINASRLSAIGELASGVAHEINNPLASVAGYAEEMLDLICEEKNLNSHDLEDFKDYLTTIIDQTYRCKAITQNLLNFARQTDFSQVKISLNGLIEKTLSLLELDEKVVKAKIVTDFGLEPCPVETDPSQLQQVFLNMLKNAIAAVGSDGLITLRTRYENGTVTVQFQDNGIGIPKENLEKIFSPFFTTKPPGSGTGLGLSICSSIIGNLKGTIDVQSEVGSGTTFTITLPTGSSGEKSPKRFSPWTT